MPRVIAPQPCVYVPAVVPDASSKIGLTDLGGQFVFCDSDLERWRAAYPEHAAEIVSKRTLSRSERPYADRAGFCVGLDKLPLVAEDAKRRNVPVVVVLAEGISDYLTALTLVEPWQPWPDAAQCVVGAVGVGQLVATTEAVSSLIAPAGAHLVAIADNDSGSADQGAQRSIDAVLRWRELGGASARLLVCAADLSADWRADPGRVLGAMDCACGERDGVAMVPMPGADMAHFGGVLAAKRAKVQAQPQPKPRRYKRPSRRSDRGRQRQPFAGFDDVAAALGPWGAVRRGDEWRARCPAHNGTKRNLSLRRGDNGGPVVKCWSRDCGKEAVLRGLNLWVEAR